jgi:hypothetical protein
MKKTVGKEFKTKTVIADFGKMSSMQEYTELAK